MSAITRWRLDWVFALAAASLLVLYPLATHLRSGDYVMAHDADIPATAAKALAQIEILKQINGGLVQGISPPISFNSAIAYGLPLALGADATVTQAIAMTLTFALVLALAIAGFERLLGHWEGPAGVRRRVDACLLGALYVVAPFSLIYMSNGIFWSINVALAIGVLPLLFYFHQRCFVDRGDHFEIGPVAALSACVTLVAWSVLFIFPTLVMMVTLLAVRGRFTRSDARKLLVLGALVLLGALPALYGMYLSAIDAGWRAATDPVTANAAFESISGGVLTGLLQYATWLIYTPWTPRLVMGFPSHFLSAGHVALALLLLGIAILLPMLDRREPVVRRYLGIVFMLLVGLFLVKGGGQPFGELFRAILNYVPGAGLIRTPDTKFGAFVILGLACIAALTLAGNDPRLAWFRGAVRTVIVASVAYHAVALVDGSAILARDSQFADASFRGYAVTPTAAERRIADVLEGEPSVGVMLLPPEFGLTTRRDGGVFTYRNVIAEFVSNPFYYSAWDASSAAIMQRMKDAVDEGDWRPLAEMGIGFVLVDRNAITARASHHELYAALQEAPDAWIRVVDEGGYELYRLADRWRTPWASVVSADGSRPVRVLARSHWFALFETEPSSAPYSIVIRSPENAHWALTALPEGCRLGVPLCVAWSLVGRPHAIARISSSQSELSNRWQVRAADSERTTRGGRTQQSERLVLVFIPQLLMLLFLGSSIATVLACIYVASRSRLAADRPGSAGMAP